MKIYSTTNNLYVNQISNGHKQIGFQTNPFPKGTLHPSIKVLGSIQNCDDPTIQLLKKLFSINNPKSKGLAEEAEITLGDKGCSLGRIDYNVIYPPRSKYPITNWIRGLFGKEPYYPSTVAKVKNTVCLYINNTLCSAEELSNLFRDSVNKAKKDYEKNVKRLEAEEIIGLRKKRTWFGELMEKLGLKHAP